eukprot:snap_masked-scaffold_27-processed-gene-4.13-mRNA-1 protein AED:1.00 eAED:1.00 QI:0/-1/0/0/-1/1/1/0/98
MVSLLWSIAIYLRFNIKEVHHFFSLLLEFSVAQRIVFGQAQLDDENYSSVPKQLGLLIAQNTFAQHGSYPTNNSLEHMAKGATPTRNFILRYQNLIND